MGYLISGNLSKIEGDQDAQFILETGHLFIEKLFSIRLYFFPILSLGARATAKPRPPS